MKRSIPFFVSFLLCGLLAGAQSKVFREVSSEISSQMKLITQDEALIGYLMFTQLEKVNADSFNYQVSIMDENLNDIGKLNFKDKNLELRSVSFEQDILCLGYVKSDLADLKNTSMKKIRKAMDAAGNAVFTQLINLKGDIIHSSSIAVDLALKEELAYVKNSRPSVVAGRLKHDLVLKNIPGKGFVGFYGDQEKNRLFAFDIAGKELWSKNIPDAQAFGMLTTTNDVYVLSKRKMEMLEGGYEVRGFAAGDGNSYDKYELKDKKGSQLKVLGFETDPNSGKPIITGSIIDPVRGNNFYTVTALSKGPYDGVFTVSLNGPRRADIKETFSYWSDGSKAPEISASGLVSDNHAYPRFSSSIRDFKGNTYFVGNSYIRKPKVGSIVASILLSPTIIFPIFISAGGYNKGKAVDAVLMRQDSAGRLRFENAIEGQSSRFYAAKMDLSYYGFKTFYTVSNPTTKSNFLIVDDFGKTVIYNVDTRRVMRTVSHREGSVSTAIFPAKQGHIMVVENNRRERYTKLSIEAL
ncbi:MAG: PepSY domain-containing protein [Chitinophagaceae bacterium]|nr:MAG: PepSY domain-containing protein [Chitinophagaceae bacterium]